MKWQVVDDHLHLTFEVEGIGEVFAAVHLSVVAALCSGCVMSGDALTAVLGCSAICVHPSPELRDSLTHGRDS